MPIWLNTSLNVTALVFMVISLFGLVVPIFPGLVVIWGIMLIHGLLTGFSVGWWVFGLVTVLMIIGSLIDNVLMGAKAHQGGAAWWTIALALVSAVAASFLLTPLVGLLAAPLALWLLEFVRTKDKAQAWQTTRALLIGWGWAFVVRFALGLVMVGAWAWAVWQ